MCHTSTIFRTHTVVEKSFRTPLKFYTISNIIMKYLWKNLFCVSKGAAALDRHKQIQIILLLFIIYKKNKILDSFNISVPQHCQYQSQQITENVFKTEQKINKPSHYQIIFSSPAISTH